MLKYDKEIHHQKSTPDNKLQELPIQSHLRINLSQISMIQKSNDNSFQKRSQSASVKPFRQFRPFGQDQIVDPIDQILKFNGQLSEEKNIQAAIIEKLRSQILICSKTISDQKEIIQNLQTKLDEGTIQQIRHKAIQLRREKEELNKMIQQLEKQVYAYQQTDQYKISEQLKQQIGTLELQINNQITRYHNDLASLQKDNERLKEQSKRKDKEYQNLLQQHKNEIVQSTMNHENKLYQEQLRSQKFCEQHNDSLQQIASLQTQNSNLSLIITTQKDDILELEQLKQQSELDSKEMSSKLFTLQEYNQMLQNQREREQKQWDAEKAELKKQTDAIQQLYKIEKQKSLQIATIETQSLQDQYSVKANVSLRQSEEINLELRKLNLQQQEQLFQSQKRLDTLQSENQYLQDKILNFEAQIHILDSSKYELQEMYVKYQQNQSYTEDLQKQKAAINTQLQDSLNENSLLQSQLDTLQEIEFGSEISLQQHEKEVSKLRRQLIQKDQEFKFVKSINEEIEQKYNHSIIEYQLLQKLVSSQNIEKQELFKTEQDIILRDQQQRQQYMKLATELEFQKSITIEYDEKLQQTVQQKNVQEQQFKREKDSLQNQINHQRKLNTNQIEDLQSKVIQLQQQLSQFEKTEGSLRSQISQLQQDNKVLMNRNVELQDILKQNYVQIEYFQVENKQLSRQYETIVHSNDNSQQEKNAIITKLTEKYNSLLLQNTNAQSSCNQMSVKSKQIEEEQLELIGQINDQRREIISLENSNDILQRQVMKTTDQDNIFRELQQQLGQSKAELSLFQQKEIGMNQQISLNAEQLRAQLILNQELSYKLDVFQRKFNIMNSQMVKLSQDLSVEKNLIAGLSNKFKSDYSKFLLDLEKREKQFAIKIAYLFKKK